MRICVEKRLRIRSGVEWIWSGEEYGRDLVEGLEGEFCRDLYHIWNASEKL